MKLKEFLKPEWRKVFVFIILSIVLFLFEYGGNCPDCQFFQGIPLPIYIWGGILGVPKGDIVYSFLAMDIIAWYLLSCLIVWVFEKFGGKKK